ncbi:uncharacterized protein BT62DRAFT_899415 [Guyanagaster necrorhizus]|uniref:Uncharacterized protein n=1 Tax=Guyanagaster necrorhizus TaxID=856835 RepID=A0A9P7VNS8_9AGAR|nr:uncharacterized protein BT62DRAFT_899415 [Guyanagaster necrorhizus MCA 3950]KAG7444598.1 hypothetical protein BT62DRAFT_899415 [Guyanagaster necrorhizus MCA 3950]
MSTGWNLFREAQTLYARGDADGAFKRYQKAIKKIVNDENVMRQLPIPGEVFPDDTYPRQTLGAAWRNFIGLFKDSALGKTRENSPDAYKLLYRYRPTSTKDHARFSTKKARLYLTGMQITAGLTLGLLAWEENDRPTAMKRFREALELAAANPPYSDLANARQPWDRFVYMEVNDVRDGLAEVFQNDPENAQLLEMYGVEGGDMRKEVFGVGYVKYEADGGITFERNVMVASDTWTARWRRDVKLRKYCRCKEIARKACIFTWLLLLVCADRFLRLWNPMLDEVSSIVFWFR